MLLIYNLCFWLSSFAYFILLTVLIRLSSLGYFIYIMYFYYLLLPIFLTVLFRLYFSSFGYLNNLGFLWIFFSLLLFLSFFPSLYLNLFKALLILTPFYFFINCASLLSSFTFFILTVLIFFCLFLFLLSSFVYFILLTVLIFFCLFYL